MRGVSFPKSESDVAYRSADQADNQKRHKNKKEYLHCGNRQAKADAGKYDRQNQEKQDQTHIYSSFRAYVGKALLCISYAIAPPFIDKRSAGGVCIPSWRFGGKHADRLVGVGRDYVGDR